MSESSKDTPGTSGSCFWCTGKARIHYWTSFRVEWARHKGNYASHLWERCTCSKARPLTFAHPVHYNTLALTFRPFLVAHVNHQKSASTRASDGTQPREELESIPWLEEACACAVGAARDLIRFLARAINQNIVARVRTDIHRSDYLQAWLIFGQGLRLFAYYLEAACFLLIYDTLRDWTTRVRNLSDVRVGLQCLSSLVPGSSIRTNTFSIQRLLEALNKIELERADRISSILSGNVFAPPADLDFPSAGHDGTANRSVVADLPFETLLQFPAGWATFENECYLNQNAVLEPELFNPDLANINWEFDNVFVDDRAIF